MTQPLPDPLVPPDVDLRGLEYMPLLGGRLFSSDFDLEATDAEFRAGLKLWWKAWNQQPAGSLPNNERMLCKLAGFDDNLGKWRKLRDRALHGFTLCSDGRLYHPVLAEQALIAWEKRGEDRAKRDNEAERQRRNRAERSRMFDQLRDAGVTPKWDVSTAELRELVTKHVTPPVTRTGPEPVTPPVTRTATAKTGRDGTGIQNQGASGVDSTTVARSPGEVDDDPPEANGQPPTAAGRICRAMRQAGLASTNPGDPRLLALIEQGVTETELIGVAAEAVAGGKGWPWVLHVALARRVEAASIAVPPRRAGPPATVPSSDERAADFLREQDERAAAATKPPDAIRAIARRAVRTAP